MLQKIGYVVFFLLYKIFLRIEVRGKEHLRGMQGPIILASNHTSELDVTAMPLLFPFFSTLLPIYFVSNQTEKYKTFGWRSYIYGGLFFNLLGGYSVYSGFKDYAIALEDHVELLRHRGTVCIFPEGKRTRDGQMNPARGGLGYLMHATQASVVPVAIDTFFHISPWDFFAFRRRVVMTVGKPISSTEYMKLFPPAPSVDDYRDVSQMVLDRVRQMMS